MPRKTTKTSAKAAAAQAAAATSSEQHSAASRMFQMLTDILGDEAMQLNMKALADRGMNELLYPTSILNSHLESTLSNERAYLEELRSQRLLGHTAATDELKRLMGQETRAHGIELDRVWNLDEQSALFVQLIRDLSSRGVIDTGFLANVLAQAIEAAVKKD